jgi:hypothetical protein
MLNGYYFYWNEKGREMYPERTSRDIGVMAQELAQVCPELVILRENGYYAVSYEKLAVLLLQAIKELKDKLID